MITLIGFGGFNGAVDSVVVVLPFGCTAFLFFAAAFAGAGFAPGFLTDAFREDGFAALA